MNPRAFLAVIVLAGGALCASAAEPPQGLDPADRDSINRDLKDLQDRIARLRSAKDAPSADLLADAEVHVKGVLWALRYETRLEPKDVDLIKKALQRGKQRADALAAGKQPWADKRGTVVRAYRSSLDGSVQPYAVTFPAEYGKAPRKWRIDIVLHGRDAGLTEVSFLHRHNGDRLSNGVEELQYAPRLTSRRMRNVVQ